MMTLNAQTENNVNEVNQNTEMLNCSEKHYIFTANELSENYKNHMLSCLEGENDVVKTEVEFEDSERFAKGNLINLTTPRNIPISEEIVKEYSKPREKILRTFDRKKVSILVMYAVMVLVVVIALALTVPGTAWEHDHIDVTLDTSKIDVVVNGQPGYAQEQAMNVMLTENGPVEIQLTPYETKEEIHTNWFDKLCDWVSNVVGG